MQVDFSKLVVYHTKRSLGSSLLLSALHPDVAAGMDAALAFLEQQGATLVEFKDEECESVKEMFTGLNAFRVWSSLMSKHRHEPFAVTIREGLEERTEEEHPEGMGSQQHQRCVARMTFVTAFVELLKSLVDMSFNTFPAMLLAVAEFISDLPLLDSENQQQCAEGLRLKEELEFLLSPEYKYEDICGNDVGGRVDSFSCDTVSLDSEVCDSEKDNKSKDVSGSVSIKSKLLSQEHVLLLPSLPTPAPFHAESILRLFDTSNTAFFNVMELPVTAVPLGLSKPHSSGSGGGVRHRGKKPLKRGGVLSGASNLPVGMQVVGGPGRDHVSKIPNTVF